MKSKTDKYKSTPVLEVMANMYHENILNYSVADFKPGGIVWSNPSVLAIPDEHIQSGWNNFIWGVAPATDKWLSEKRFIVGTMYFRDDKKTGKLKLIAHATNPDKGKPKEVKKTNTRTYW